MDLEIAPHLGDWDAAADFPAELYRKAAAAGVTGMGFDAELGGTGEDIDLYHRIIFAEEFFRLGIGRGVRGPGDPLDRPAAGDPAGAEEMRERVARPVLAGEKTIAFAVTEPSGGSDVAAFQTTATRDGDHYIVNGDKALISGAMRADFLLTAVRTGGPGAGGLSLLLIETERPGVIRAPTRGLAWYNRNNGSISFENVKVPAANLIGPENRGFAGLTGQFNIERFSGIAATLSMTRTCVAEAIAWGRERRTFGQRLIDHQVMRHKIIDMVGRISAAYAWLDVLVWRFTRGDVPVADLALLKVQATTTLEHCARETLRARRARLYRRQSH